MKQSKSELLSEQWFDEWRILLSGGLAVRSFVDLEHPWKMSTFDAELICMVQNSNPRVFQARFTRTLGTGLGDRYSRFTLLDLPFEKFLTDWCDRLARTTSVAYSEKILAPVPHIAQVSRLYARDTLCLPPSHPLLLLYYGMVYDEMRAERLIDSADNQTRNRAERDFLKILGYRFDAFLFQQQRICSESTIGQIL